LTLHHSKIETARLGDLLVEKKHLQITNSQEVFPDKASTCLKELPWAWLSLIFGYDKPHVIRPPSLGMDLPMDSQVSDFFPSYGVLGVTTRCRPLKTVSLPSSCRNFVSGEQQLSLVCLVGTRGQRPTSDAGLVRNL